MRSIKVTFLFIIFSVTILAADNLLYYYSHSSTWELDAINGATFSRSDTLPCGSNVEKPMLDQNNQYMVFSGDFNGDGRKDVGYIYNNADGFHQTLKIYDVSNGTLLFYSDLADANDGKIIYAVVGDFNGDGKDEVGIVYNNADGYHQTFRVTNLYNNTQYLFYTHLLDASQGKIIFTTVGDFDGDGKDEVGIVFNNSDGYHQTFRVINLYNNTQNLFYTHLLDASQGKIIFTTIGDFNGDGKDEIGIVFNNADGYHQTFRVINLYNNTQDLFYTHLIDASQGTIISTVIGDFNGDGKDEIGIVFNNADGYHQTFRVTNLYNNTQILYNIHLADASNGKIINTIAGDFNGDGRDELGYFYNNAANSNQTIKMLDLNTGTFSSYPINNVSTDTLKYLIKIGPISKYMSIVQDKTFKPIPSNKTLSATNTFNIGWYNGDDIVTAPYIIKNNLISNSFLPYLDPDHQIGITTQWVSTYLSIMNNKANMVLLKDSSLLLYDATFKSQFNQINSSYNNIAGYYIGDDFARLNGNNPNKWTIFKSLYTYVKNNIYNNKYCYAAENWYYLSDAYPLFDSPAIPWDIPMMENYIYKKDDSNPEYTFFHMINITGFIEQLRSKVLLNNQPGFIYIAQAHGTRFAVNSTDQFDPRAASWKESRYDVYNAIVHGAGGIFYWGYQWSDWFGNPYPLTPRPDYMVNLNNTLNENVMQNLNSITQEIACGPSLGLVGSLHKALMNGRLPDSCEVYCSKDGYDGDYNTDYSGREDNENQYINSQKGKDIADINYIVRADNGIYYIVAVNNSKNTVQNVKFYIRSFITQGNQIFEVKTNNVGTQVTPITKNTLPYNKKGKTYSTFTEQLFTPFEVKIYKIGTSGTYSMGNPIILDKPITGIANPSQFELFNCYPNPFNPSTTIKYQIPIAGLVTLKIYDILGREVAMLVNENKIEGFYEVNFDASKLASGIYIYQLKSNNFVSSKKMTLLK